MKRIILLIIVSCSLAVVNAQNFVITPNQHRIDTVIYDNYEAYDIYLTTPNPEAITFKWKMLSNTLPAAWSYSLCDHGACYVGIPTTTETMDAITLTQSQNGVQGFLKINLTTGLNYGSGKVVFYVYDATNINRGDTISFDIRWPAPLSVSEISLENSFSIYPNPAKNNFTIKNNSEKNSNVTVTNLIGEIVYTDKITVNDSKNIDISELPRGAYFVVFESENEKFTKKIIVN